MLLSCSFYVHSNYIKELTSDYKIDFYLSIDLFNDFSCHSVRVKCDVISETESSGSNGVDIPHLLTDNRTEAKGRTFPNTIKDCIQTCRRLLFRGDRDLNYCIEGCRIRIYRRIYECVFDQCNEKGNGIPTKFSREQYHQCVYLCKVKPKIKASSSTRQPTFTTTTTASPSTAKILIKDSTKYFIPLEYHYFNDKKKKIEKLHKNSLN